MKAIPTKIRNKIADDPFMKNCCIDDGNCDGRVEWHHVWIYAGGQINEGWAIVPACEYHHAQANRSPVKEMFQISSLRRATAMDLMKYPKKNWKQITNYLKNHE